MSSFTQTKECESKCCNLNQPFKDPKWEGLNYLENKTLSIMVRSKIMKETLEGSKTWRDIKAQQSYGLPYISKRYCNCLYMAITIIYYSLISTLLFVKNYSIAHSILSMPSTCNFLFLQYLFIAKHLLF